MRILAVTTSWPHSEDPAAGKFVRALHTELVKQGHSVTTVFARHDLTEAIGFGPWGRTIPTIPTIPDSMRLVGLGGMESIARVMGVFRAYRAYRDLGASITHAVNTQIHDADVILAHWAAPTGIWAGACVGESSIPIVAVAHGGDTRLLRRPILGYLSRRDLRGNLAGLVSTNAEGVRVVGGAARLPPGRIVQTPMGYDDEFFRPRNTAPSRTVADDAPVVAAGRFIAIKGFDVLIEAMNGVGRRLVLAGDGLTRGLLAEEAERHGVDLDMPGQLPPQELAQLFHQAALVVVPSRVLYGGTEGFPVTALEALACGTPVIATSTGGLPDLFPPSHLVPPDNAVALRAAILKQLATPSFPQLARPLEELTCRAVASRISSLLKYVVSVESERHGAD